ncbi:MAG: tetratricopeptide repeat protein [bacterium]
MKLLILAISISLALGLACGRDERAAEAPPTEIRWYASVEEARAGAEAGGNLVLMSFEASWDPWSQLLHDSLYVHPDVIDSLIAFSCTRVDVDVDTLARQEFGVNLYPTIVITDAYGSELGRIIGYQAPPVFLDALSPIKNRLDRVSGMFAVEGMRRNDAEFLLTFGNILFEMGVYDAALMRYEWAGEMDPDNASGIREESMFAMGECYMLSGRDRSAARTFRSFASNFPESERTEEALLLAALCYERGGYSRAARDVLRSYRSLFEEGRFSEYVEDRLEEGDR